jgi:phage tail-like protein
MPETEQEKGLYDIPFGFHFKVEFGEGPNGDSLNIDKDSMDIRFQEVTGLTAEVGIENYEEGGENRFSHRLPTRSKFNNLVLKRGMLFNTKLHRWFQDALLNFTFEPLNATVQLMNDNNEVLEAWEFHSVWPVKWALSDFKAAENAIVIETLELAYQYFERKNVSTNK